jgi:hypothetical protein
MNRCVVCVFACLAMLLGASLAVAEGIVAEVYRSPHGWPRRFAVDPSDGSVWGMSGTSVVHLDAEGNLVYQYTRARDPVGIALNVTDGSCWVADLGAWDGTQYVGSALVRLTRDGAELCRANYSTQWAGSLSVDQRDGSLWFISPNDAFSESGTLMHLSATGALLDTITTVPNPGSVAVSSLDGTLWVWDMGDTSGEVPSWRVLHLGAEGAVIGEWPGFGGDLSVNSADGSCWVGSYNIGVGHLSADNEVLWSRAIYRYPFDIVANPADGSCWIQYFPSEWVTNCGQTLALVSASGSELRRLSPPQLGSFPSLAVNPADGSLWAGAGAGWAHLAADGTVLQQDRGLRRPYALAVNPSDGGYWIAGGQECGTAPEPAWVARYDALGNELWRQADLASPDSLAPDLVDGSIWVADIFGVAHYAADGTRLAFPDTHGAGGPNWVVVDPRDRSLWVSDSDQLRHYGADGALLKTITYSGVYSSTIYHAQLAPDGSLWAIGFRDNYPEPDTGGTLIHITPDGTCTDVGGLLQVQSLSVNPVDGSVWTSDFGVLVQEPLPAQPFRITHFSADGTSLWQGGQQYNANRVAVDPRTGNCWLVGDGGAVYLLSPTAEELGHTERTNYVTFSVTANPADGTLWLLDESSQLCKVASSGPFTDVAATSWAAQAISLCAAADVVKGYWDGTYHPEGQVTRDQMAVYLARALCGSDADVPEGPSTPSFGDVPPAHWAYKQIEYCKAQSIVQGYADGYRPAVALDRGQMATFLARAVAPFPERPDLPGYSPPATPSFPDVSADFWAYKPIEYVRLRYVAGGYPDGRYHPEAACTRDQMAVFMARAFHLLK